MIFLKAALRSVPTKVCRLSEEEIEYILACAGTAPSAGNLESWDVVVVTDEEVRAALSQAAFDQPHVEQAAAVFVVCANYVRSMSRYGERGILYGLEDAVIACTYMMLGSPCKKTAVLLDRGF